VGIHRTWASGLEPFTGPPAGRARSPRALAPIIVEGRGILSPKRPEARLPELGRPVSVFPAILYNAGPSVLS
jgi:hypothetical protein